ncbi:MAG: quinone oxidoreductase family protein [Carbonactinosporaceae bacterium]
MHSVVVTRPGGPEVLELTDGEAPSPGPGEVLVAVAASGVNFIDVYRRTGIYPVPTPFVAGSEGAGTVTEVGPGVAEIAPGDRVAWATVAGSYADQAVVPAEQAVPVPDGVPTETAAAIMLQGMTAHYLTHDTHRVQPGDTALVHAAAGGMGLLLTQLVRLRGGRVIATVSTPEKERLARDAGAHEVIRYSEADFPAEVARLTDGQGVHVVYDGVGRTTFDGSLASLRQRGMLALYGQASGPVPELDLRRLAERSLFITRPTLAHHIATRKELLTRATAVLDLVEAGELQVRVGTRYALAEARTAHEDLEARRTTGKLLLVPG